MQIFDGTSSGSANTEGWMRHLADVLGDNVGTKERDNAAAVLAAVLAKK